MRKKIYMRSQAVLRMKTFIFFNIFFFFLERSHKLRCPMLSMPVNLIDEIDHS